ncbi:hypothetical protein CANMA_002010 [Candida margitis]|uniref:uncharacterized protein n=1 Tax=Candida margitis TaxID=1775924 RepID=UPI0022271C59|nr:uncharacterized protein CANMA_002010 [Candida margitis]KAI5969014.1 hypothetical protein CANMA_002010 [Candida margitis]
MNSDLAYHRNTPYQFANNINPLSDQHPNSHSHQQQQLQQQQLQQQQQQQQPRTMTDSVPPTSIDPLDTITSAQANDNNNNNNNNHFESTPRTPAPPISPTNFRQSSGAIDKTVPSIHKYSRRVSFNNLNPVDDGDFLYNRPIYNQVTNNNNNSNNKQYSSYSGPSATANSLGSDATSPVAAPAQLSSTYNNENYRYGTSPTRQSSFPFSSLPKVPNFDVISQSPGSAHFYSQQQQRKRRLKLPNPPEKSILKNKVSQQQLDYNYKFGGNIEDATINYHQEEEEEAQAQPDAQEDEEEQEDEGHRARAAEARDAKDSDQPPQRRKSYAGMTDEELLALDPQFNMKPKTSNFDAFKFDNQKIYYTDRRSSTSGVSALGKLQAQQQQYPSSNENNYRSIALTVQHDDYDQIELRRTLLTTISGRKHSWNSLDWLLRIGDTVSNEQSILHDGDYLIVASFISQKFVKEYNSKRRKQSFDDYLKAKCQNLLDYFKLSLAQLDLCIKMTVEFVIENGLETSEQHGNEYGSKFMLTKLVKQYHPNIFIVGIKSSNLNFKYKIKKNSERSYLVKYSSFIVKHAGIPVVLVSSSSKGTMTDQKRQGRQSQSQSQSQEQQQEQSKSPVPRITFSDDLVAVGSNSSSSIESVESFAPQTTSTPPDEQSDNNEGIISDPSILYNSIDKYHTWISAISDKSFTDSINYLRAVNTKDDSLKIDGKIHQIYKSQSYGHPSSSLHATSTNGSSTTSRHSSIASDGSGSGAGGGSGSGSAAGDNVYRVKSLISIEDDEEAKKRKEMRRKRRASGSAASGGANGSGGSSSGFLSSMKSNDSGGSSGNETKGKKSFWRKIGFKKG